MLFRTRGRLEFSLLGHLISSTALCFGRWLLGSCREGLLIAVGVGGRLLASGSGTCRGDLATLTAGWHTATLLCSVLCGRPGRAYRQSIPNQVTYGSLACSHFPVSAGASLTTRWAQIPCCSPFRGPLHSELAWRRPLSQSHCDSCSSFAFKWVFYIPFESALSHKPLSSSSSLSGSCSMN